MDWDDLRFFLELARAKRLTRAGRRLDVDHTTVARRVERLEAALGCRLFEQTADGYALTDAGHRLIERAEAIESGVGLLEDEARGEGGRVEGVVRIGVPEGFGAAFLVPRLGRLLAEHPRLDVELLTLPRFPSLAAREADIVVTIDPPEHGRYIASRLADYTYGLFASKAYLARHGAIRRVADLEGHEFVGYLDDMLLSPQLRYLDGLPPHRLRVATSGMLAQVAAVRAGLGLGVLTHYLAAGTGLKSVLPREAIWKRTFWITTHADGYKLRRVRVAWDYVRAIAEAESTLFVGGAGAPRQRAVRARSARPRVE